MNRSLVIFAAALAASGSANGASKQFKEKDPVSIEAGRAYVLLQSDFRNDVQIVRIADDKQRVEWEDKRLKALEKAKRDYARAKLRYDEDSVLWAKGDPMIRQGSKPVKPKPVDEASFIYPPPELANFTTIFGGRTFTKADGAYSYFIALDPGTYVIYRNGLMSPCLCMGSIRFEAVAGKIVDLGQIRNGKGQWLFPATAAMSRPPQLTNQPIEPARLGAAGKLPNFFGTLIGRMPEMPGVLAYDRDIPLDVADGNAPMDGIR